MATTAKLRAGTLLAATVLVTLPLTVPTASAAAAAPPRDAAAAAPSPGAGASAGAQSLNDRLFPGLGNGGYDAKTYDVSLTYRPGTDKMPGAVTMRALATQSLSDFSLDSVAQQIQSVTVDGRPAQYRLAAEKLIVKPARPIHKHLPFTVHVVYTADRSLKPTPPGLDLPPGIAYPFDTWNNTPDGFGIMGQPNRTHLVFPSNDHPSDKAKYTFRITAPNDRTAVAGGHLASKYRHRGETTWVYRTAHPIKTDVVQIAVGRFREIKQTGPHHLPVRSYLALAPFQGKTYTDAMEVNARETPDQLAWLEKQIGRPFPYEQYGVLGLTSGYDGVALETAGLSTFGLGLSLPPKDEAVTLVHELTHQYFGDAVSVRSWDDMWLSEGHARYYERRYGASRGFLDLNEELKELYQQDQKSRDESGPMGHLNDQFAVLFDTDVPGQLMLTGLNTIVGDATFRRIEQTFFDRYRDRNADTQDYIDIANQVSGRDLTQYFHAWIYGKKTPPMPGHPDWHSQHERKAS